MYLGKSVLVKEKGRERQKSEIKTQRLPNFVLKATIVDKNFLQRGFAF